MKRQIILAFARRRLNLLIALLLLSISPSLHAQQDAPYLYYYSHDEQAFVIERADGSDKQIWLRYSLPGNYDYVTGPGWSPSGRWFVWTNDSTAGYAVQDIYLVNRNDDTPVVLLQGVIRAELEWSPAKDLLLISYFVDTKETTLQDVLIYNPETNSQIFHRNTEAITGIKSTLLDTGWSPDGELITLTSYQMMSVLQLNGTEYASMETTLTLPLGLQHCGKHNTLPRWLDDNNTLAYVMLNELGVVIEDIHTREKTVFHLQGGGAIQFVDWSQDYRFALVYVYTENMPYEVWLLSRPNKTIRLISGAARFDGIDCSFHQAVTTWNSENEAAVVSEEGSLYILNGESEQLTPVNLPDETQIERNSATMPIIWNLTQEMVLNVLSTTTLRNGIYSYDTEQNRLTRWIPAQEDKSISPYNFSLLNGKWIIYNMSMLDLRTGITTKINQSDTSEVGSIQLAETFWHPSEDWFFGVLTPADGLRVYVVEVDNPSARFLTSCIHFSASCFGWLE